MYTMVLSTHSNVSPPTICYWNCRPLSAHLAPIASFLHSPSAPLVLALVETWPNAIRQSRTVDDPYHTIRIPGYTFMHAPPPPTHMHGGIGFYVRDGIAARLLPSPLTTTVTATATTVTQIAWLELGPSAHSLLLGCWYIHALATDAELASLDMSIADATATAAATGAPLLLLGDVNTELPTWGSATATGHHQFIDNVIQSYDMACLNTLTAYGQHTRAGPTSSSIIDIAFTCTPHVFPSMIVDTGTHPLAGMSDHLSLTVSLPPSHSHSHSHSPSSFSLRETWHVRSVKSDSAVVKQYQEHVTDALSVGL